MKESPIVVGNRYVNSIVAEIKLLEGRIEKHKEDMEYGFTFHNLASPCEMLEKYYGTALRAAGFTFLMDKIQEIASQARAFERILETEGKISTYIVIWNNYLKKLLPILFFL